MSSQDPHYRLPCPNCKANLVIPDLEGGVDIVCPRCKQEFPSETVDPALITPVSPAKQEEKAPPPASPKPAEAGERPESAARKPAAGKKDVESKGIKPREIRPRERPAPSPGPESDDLHHLMEEAQEPGEAEDSSTASAKTPQGRLSPARPEKGQVRKPKPDVMPTDTEAASPRHHRKHKPGKKRKLALLLLPALVLAGVFIWMFAPDPPTEKPATEPAPADDIAEADAEPVAAEPTDAAEVQEPAPSLSAALYPENPMPAGAGEEVTEDQPPGEEKDESAELELAAVAELPENFSLQEFLTAGRPPAPERKNWQKAAALAQVALESPSWQDLLGYVRAPEHVKPLMRGFYEENPYAPKLVDTITGLRLTTDDQDRTFAFVVVQLENFDLVRMSMELVDDQFRLDWESFVGLQEMPWSDFRFKKPSEPVEFRVGIIEENSLGVAQITKSAFHAFRLVRPGEASLPAYLPKAHPDAAELFTMVQDGRSHDVILKLRYAPDPAGGQFVEIVELVQKGWVREYAKTGGESPDS